MNDFALENPRRDPGGQAESDFYPTPPSLAKACVQKVLEIFPIGHIKGRPLVAEPGCGEHAPFLRFVDELSERDDIEKFGIDLREIEKPKWFGDDPWTVGESFLDCYFTGNNPDLIITNPPFSLAAKFVEHARNQVKPFGLVAMLLRVTIEGSNERIDFWKANPYLHRFVIVPRPSFVGGNDNTEYCLYTWPGHGLQDQLERLGRAQSTSSFLRKETPGPWR